MGMFTVGAGFLSSILFPNWGGNIWYAILLGIDSIVYRLIATTYRIFFLVAEANIFDVNDRARGIGQITNNIYIILGVAMLFILAYNIILMIINPDKTSDTSDKSSVGLLKNTVISVVAIALLPLIFNTMAKVQHEVLESDIIGHVILGGSTVVENTNIKLAGTEVALNIFTAFFHPIDESTGASLSLAQCMEKMEENETCKSYVTAYYDAIDSGNIGQFIFGDDLGEALSNDKIQYMYLISTAAGIFAAYLFLSFSLDLGVRAVKLAVLQLIAPIPLILRITKPSGGMYSRWIKQLIDTYLMVFIRVIIIYFAMFTIQVVIDSLGGNIFSLFDTVDSDGSGVGLAVALANVIVILGILQFAKDAPKLVENLIGSNGTLKWKIKDKLDENEYAKRAATGIGANVSNTIKGVADIAAGRNPYGEDVGRWKALGSHLYNAPAATIRGFGAGWKRGGNVSFKNGYRNAFGQMKEESFNAVSDIQTAVDRAHDVRKLGQFGKNKNINIPGLSRIIGEGKRARDIFKERNAGGISARFNRNAGAGSIPVIRDAISTIDYLFSSNDSGVSDIKSGFEGEQKQWAEYYNDQMISTETEINDLLKNITNDKDRAEAMNLFTEMKRARIKDSTGIDKQLAEMLGNFKFASAADKSSFEKAYKDLRQLELSKSLKRTELADKSKLAQMAKTGDNLSVNPENRGEYVRDLMASVRKLSEGMSTEQLQNAMKKSFKPTSGGGARLGIDIDLGAVDGDNRFIDPMDALSKLGDYLRNGEFKMTGSDDMLSIKENGELLYALNSFETQLKNIQQFSTRDQGGGSK